MKKWRTIVYIFGMAVMLAACGSGKEDIQIVEQEEITEIHRPENEEPEKSENTQAPEEKEQPEETVESIENDEPEGLSEGKPAVVNIEKEEQEYKDGDTTVLATSYDHVTVAIEGNEAAAEAVMAELEKREETFADNVAETLEWAKESPVVDEALYYELGQEYAITRNDGRVLAFSTMSSGYEGGAHGYYMEYGLNFDAETGQALSAVDTAEDEAAFREICVQEMRRQYDNLKEQQILFEEEMVYPSLQEVLEGKLEGTEWYFTTEGIRFISNIYEIAPYAAGEITFDVPYEMVNEVLKERYRG